MITTDYLSLLDRFNLIVKKRVTSSYVGSRVSSATGRGSTIKDHRIYATGDDFRLIDWKIYARTDNLYIKRFEEERNLTVHVILDISNSMNFGAKMTKFEYAAMLGVGFAYLSLKENEKFQFATFGETLNVFSPRKGMAHLASMVQYLNELKLRGGSKFLDSMRQYKKLIGSKAMLILLSDFLFDLDQIKEALYLFSRHDLKLVHVLDPLEKNLNIEGDLKLKDLETKDEMQTFLSPNLKETYKGKLEAHSAEIEKICSRLKADYNMISTDTPIFDAFYEILKK